MVSCKSPLCLFVCLLSICPSIFLFPDDRLSEYLWIFIKLFMCIDIVAIWFGIANGQISSVFDRVTCPPHILFAYAES